MTAGGKKLCNDNEETHAQFLALPLWQGGWVVEEFSLGAHEGNIESLDLG